MGCQGEPPTYVLLWGIILNTAMGCFLRIFKDMETNCSFYTPWLQEAMAYGIIHRNCDQPGFDLFLSKWAADWEKTQR